MKTNNFDNLPLWLELSNRCNLTCGMCVMERDLTSMGVSRKDMNYEEVKKILLEAKENGAKTCIFGFRGEATLHENFIQIIEFATKLGICCQLMTNGTQFTRDFTEKVINAGLSWVSFSVTGASQMAYEKYQGYRAKYTLKQIEENIEYFIAYNKNHGNCEVRLTYIYPDYSQEEDLLNYLKKWDTKVDDIIIQPLLILHKTFRSFDVTSVGTNNGIANKLQIIDRSTKKPTRLKCRATRFLLDNTGEVVVCCNDLRLREHNNNILTTPMHVIFQSYARDFFDAVQKGDFESYPQCKTCPDSIFEPYDIYLSYNNCKKIIDFIERNSDMNIALWGFSTRTVEFVRVVEIFLPQVSYRIYDKNLGGLYKGSEILYPDMSEIKNMKDYLFILCFQNSWEVVEALKKEGVSYAVYWGDVV